jgi:hypothetical protein
MTVLVTTLLWAIGLVVTSIVVFSSFSNDLLHLPDHAARAHLHTRKELLSLPVRDMQNVVSSFPYAAVLLDIEIHNKQEHAIDSHCLDLTNPGLLHASRDWTRGSASRPDFGINNSNSYFNLIFLLTGRSLLHCFEIVMNVIISEYFLLTSQ